MNHWRIRSEKTATHGIVVSISTIKVVDTDRVKGVRVHPVAWIDLLEGSHVRV